MTETNQTSNKILETEKLLDSLSEEMMKLKSVSEVYNRTQEELQRICDSIDTLSKTSSNLANNVKSFLPALEKNLEMSNHNQVLMEKMIADLNLKVDHTLKSYRSQIETSLASTTKEIKQNNVDHAKVIIEKYEQQTKINKGLRSLILGGISIEVLIILILLVLRFI